MYRSEVGSINLESMQERKYYFHEYLLSNLRLSTECKNILNAIPQEPVTEAPVETPTPAQLDAILEAELKKEQEKQ